jgi:hypothetical protein
MAWAIDCYLRPQPSSGIPDSRARYLDQLNNNSHVKPSEKINVVNNGQTDDNKCFPKFLIANAPKR